MKKDLEFTKPFGFLSGGVHPPQHKDTAACETVFFSDVKKVIIPMQQHIGAPCKPIVSVGDEVFVGTKIGDTDQFVSAPVHSSVSGKVTKIGPAMTAGGRMVESVEIESDGKNTLDPEMKPHNPQNEKELVAAVREMGLVGLGGAGFPTYIKLTRQPDKPLDTLIINAAECEPYITADDRECIEHPDDIVDGVFTLLRLMNFERVIIAVEDNKPEAIRVLHSVASDRQDTENRVTVMKLKSRYPQGAEKMLIYSATGRKLPLGKLPADVGCVVMNVTSVSMISRYLRTGMPLTRKRLTVDGGAIKEPKNVLVPIGTPASDVVDFCGGFSEEPDKMIMGGPMMGMAVPSLDIPVLKQNNAILCFNKKEADMPPTATCIRCGRCAAACPMKLYPFRIAAALKREDIEGVSKLYADYCIECGCCSFSCPAKLPVTQTMRSAKSALKKQ